MEISSLKFIHLFRFIRKFNARFPSSLQTCQLRFQVQKLGVNFATKFASTFQCLIYCKQMFIVQVEINNSMESSWYGPVGYQEGLYVIELVIIIEYEHLFTNEVQKFC